MYSIRRQLLRLLLSFHGLRLERRWDQLISFLWDWRRERLDLIWAQERSRIVSVVLVSALVTPLTEVITLIHKVTLWYGLLLFRIQDIALLHLILPWLLLIAILVSRDHQVVLTALRQWSSLLSEFSWSYLRA